MQSPRKVANAKNPQPMNAARRFAQRRRNWRAFWGYDYLDKSQTLRPLLEVMGQKGLLGRVIVDAGSGARWMRERMQIPDGTTSLEAKHSGIFIPALGKKIIRLDIASPKLFNETGNILEMRADIKRGKPDSKMQKGRFSRAAKFLGVDPRSKEPAVDTILFSQVLNYVDFRKTILGLSTYLKKGGRIIVWNTAGYGKTGLFSGGGLKNNASLVTFLSKNGFKIEHRSPIIGLHPRGEYPIIRKNGYQYEGLCLVAVKK